MHRNGGGSRIIKKQKIRKHLQRPVRHLLGVKGVLKAFVVKFEQQPAVGGSFRCNLVYAWNSLGDLFENGLKPLRVLPLQELHDITEVVAMHVEMLLWTGQRQAARCVRGEVAEIPSLNKNGERRQFSGAASMRPAW